MLTRTPYSRFSPPDVLISTYVAEGHAVVSQEIRGCGDSQGEWFCYANDNADGHATIEWIIEQAWSNGNVGMIGRSGTGATQYAIARNAPPALFAGGTFWGAGGVTVNNLARWDGASWSGLSGPSATGVGSYGVSALAAFDDGSGPALYAGGGFETAGGLASNGIAAWRCFNEIFADDFEEGGTGTWSFTLP